MTPQLLSCREPVIWPIRPFSPDGEDGAQDLALPPGPQGKHMVDTPPYFEDTPLGLAWLTPSPSGDPPHFPELLGGRDLSQVPWGVLRGWVCPARHP